MKLVIYPAIDTGRLQRIQDVDERIEVVNADSLETATAGIEQADAFFGKITPDLLAAAQRLRWIQSPTASLEHYVFPELVEHAAELTNMRGLFSDVIADHVMGYVLCFARNLHVYFQQQASRQWAPVGDAGATADFVTGPGHVSDVDRSHLHLADCTLGVVGAGAIGSEICRRAHAFGMRLLAVDPCVEQVDEFVDVWPLERLDELLAESDFVVIAAPHTPETEKMFRRPQFETMKPTGYLINIGRGAIVDLADLTAALDEATIAGAALDVFETEPLPADHSLWGMPNVIITPHVAAASPRIAERHTQTLLENMHRFVNNEPLLTPVDKRMWF